MVRNWSYVKGKRRVKVVPSSAVPVTAMVPLWLGDIVDKRSAMGYFLLVAINFLR